MTRPSSLVLASIGLVYALAGAAPVALDQPRVEHVMIVTVDGLRWQEVFFGIDTAVANRKAYHRGDSAYLFQKYWAPDLRGRRERLMPFLWSTVARSGQLHGNRRLGSKVDVANPYWFSYPGYSEIFTGYADTAVNSNSLPDNPHVNVLEFLHRQPGFEGRVAAFGAWQTFDRIINASRAGFPVVSGFDDCGGSDPTPRERLINEMRTDIYRRWGADECFDVFSFYAAFEHLKTRRPRVLWIGFGETDEWAHEGDYRAYVDAAHQTDAWLADLWEFVQGDAAYRDHTVLFVTVDHGRGDRQKEQWTGHGQSVSDSHETWFAIIGPGIRPGGEMNAASQIYAKQFAQTIASLLGTTFVADHPVGPRIEELFAP
jgi:hypothetical protein